MPINKFGTSLRSKESVSGSTFPFRNYVRDNALCLDDDDDDAFNARGAKIRRVAEPVEDRDVTTMSYVKGVLKDATENIEALTTMKYDALKNELEKSMTERLNAFDEDLHAQRVACIEISKRMKAQAKGEMDDVIKERILEHHDTITKMLKFERDEIEKLLYEKMSVLSERIHRSAEQMQAYGSALRAELVTIK